MVSEKSISFPQFRKYSNNKSFFKIEDNRAIDEVYYIGKKAYFQRTAIQTFVERNLVEELLNFDGIHILKIHEETYENALAEVEL